tara:strand:+ start:3382 stop:11955 length:8574 start_codon:yes stop_codon:yes gene_type:complete
MPSQYESYKVQGLINQYRANPDMFNEDQLDQLERLAADNFIDFKRKQSPFSLRRALQQATAGFAEGLTTINFIPKEPRNTGEAIFRQLGHLAGFAPGIIKAPIYGLAKITSSLTGKEIKDVLSGTITKATIAGIDRLDAIAVPMIASRATKRAIDRKLKNTGLESLDFLSRGARTRAIGEEALGLASASAISSIWKGTDAIVDSYIGGAIAGGAFGGIGNFVSLGNLFKGNAKQIDRAERALRTGLGAMVTGLPSTLRNDPTEMQIYEYLLGGFFGYNTRPAYKAAAKEWIMKPERDFRENLDPEFSKDFKNYNEKTREYILNEHEGSIKKNSENLQGASGMSLSYLEYNFPNVNWRQRAEIHLSKHYGDKAKLEATQKDINRFYRAEAGRLRNEQSTLQFVNAIVRQNSIANPQNVDFHDPVVIQRQKVIDLAKGFYEKSDKSLYPDIGQFANAMEKARDRSIIDNKPDPEAYIRNIKKVIGEGQVNSKTEAILRSSFLLDAEPVNKVGAIRFREDKRPAEFLEYDGQQIEQTTIGERYIELPINRLGKGFQFLTHGIDAEGKPFKILKSSTVGQDIVYELDRSKTGLMQDALASKNKYIYSPVKDKSILITANFKDTITDPITQRTQQITKEVLFDLLSRGNQATRDAIERSYNTSLKVEKQIFNNADLHERKWVSNVMHDAEIHGLIKGNNITGIRNLLTEGFGKSAADVVKRQQLFTNRMTPVSRSSFEKTNPDGNLRFIILEDSQFMKLKNSTGESDTDGGMFFRQKFFDAGLKGMGLDPNAGHFKPVIVGRTEAGGIVTKSNGQRATDVMNSFMEANNIDAVIMKSSAKVYGLNKSSSVDYTKSQFIPTELNVYKLPVDNLQISLGTYEKPYKQVMGEEVPIQLYGQTNNAQAAGFKDFYLKEVVEPSLLGSSKGKEIASNYEKEIATLKGKDKEAKIDEFVELFEKHDMGVAELPVDFVVKHLTSNVNPKLTSLFMNKINKLEKEGYFDRDFEFDSNSDYAEYHNVNKILSASMRDHYMVRNTVFHNNWHNALKKYFIKRFSNPYIEHAGKSWLKAFTPDQMAYVDIDPRKRPKGQPKEKITVGTDAKDLKVSDWRTLEKGEIYLDNAFRRMPISTEFLSPNIISKINATKKNRDPITLGEAWDYYKRSNPEKLHKNSKEYKGWKDTFSLTVIRTPADSMSGTRVLRFRGFTGQRGAGSFTHHFDNMYLGGADKDADSIKIFQGFSKNIRNYFEKVKDERAHLDPKKKQFKEYQDYLENIFHKGSKEKLKEYRGVKENDPDFEYYNVFKYSPAHRYVAGQRASSSKEGLGYGLNSAIIMRQWVDYVKAKGGSYSFEYGDSKKDNYVVELALKNTSFYKDRNTNKVSNEQYFRDLIYKIVNKSADASNDPTVIPYPKFRELLFDSMFKANVYDKKTGEVLPQINYADILNFNGNGALGLIAQAVNISKPRSRTRTIRSPYAVLPTAEITRNKGKVLKDFYIPQKYKELIGLEIGESATTTIFNRKYQIRNAGIVGEKIRYKLNEYPKDAMSIFDVAIANQKIAARFKGDKAFQSSVITNLPLRMAKAGITPESFEFNNIIFGYGQLFYTLPAELSTPIKGKKTSGKGGKLVSYSKKEIEKFVNDQMGILTKDMLVRSNSFIGKIMRVSKDMSYGLDLIGDTYGQFATIELANKHFLNIHQAMANKGVKGNITKEFIPQIFGMNKKLKKMIRDNMKNKDENFEIDTKIKLGNERIFDLADKYNINPEPMLKYFHTILLSPLTGAKQTGTTMPLLKHYKIIHGSQAIDPMTRREYYSRIEDLYNRSKIQDTPVDLQIETKLPEIPKDVFEPKATLDAFKEIDHVIKSDALDLMAINKPQVKEIKQFKKFLKDNPFLADNFNEWFKFFTGELSGRGMPRSATDFKMEDVVAINRFMKQFHDPKSLKFKLRYWNLDPRFVDSEMAIKGMVNKYQTYYAPVKYGSGKTVTEPVYRFMSPIGAISQYVLKAERGINKDRNASDFVIKPINDILAKFTANERKSIFKQLVDGRESGDKSNFTPVLKKLDSEVTKFFKNAGEKWLFTYDSNGNKVSDIGGFWKMDQDFNGWYKATGGKMNKYMRWKKDGIFDFAHFRKTVLDKDITSSDLIRTVGIDGLKRYQYEKRMMNVLESDVKAKIADTFSSRVKKYRSSDKNGYKGIGERVVENYIPHGNFGYNDAAQRQFVKSIESRARQVYNRALVKYKSPKIAENVRNRYISLMERKAQFSTEFFNMKDLIDNNRIKDGDFDVTLSELGFNTRLSPGQARTANLKGYDKREVLITDYNGKLINGWYKNLISIKGDYEINNMKYRMRNYKPKKKELKKFKESVRYNSYVDVWADYVKLYMQSVLGHQSYFPQAIMSEIERGIDPLYLKDKRNMFYLTSDQNMVKAYEKLWQSKKWNKAPFIGKTLEQAPKDKEARKEYFSRKIHNFGRMEAQYELMTLLANTGTWTTNIFSGNLMTIASAGLRNFRNAYNNDKIYSRLLSNDKGESVIKLYNGQSVKTRKDLYEWLKERGVMDNFIQNEFEYNLPLKNSLRKAGINITDFTRDITRAIKADKKVREESVLQVVDRYGVKDVMLKYGGFFMQNSERINRLNAFIAHGLQAVEKFGPDGRNLNIADSFVFEMALKGVENTQFLYQNAQRPAFMRTATGKVLSRFKLFVWNSVRVRKEFYNQAKLYGFRNGTPEYERFKDMFMIDMFLMTLGGAFMFSIFDTALAPPYDWIQSLADWMYGDKRERDMAFFGSKLGPANLLKPPIARIPEAMIELGSGDWEKFTDYTMYTMFPFGRAVRQGKQIYERPERVGEVLFRLPINKIDSRIERLQRRERQSEEIDDFLGN